MADDPIVSFATTDELWAWLAEHHRRSGGVWVRIGRARSGLASITFHELLEAGLAFGWSESKRRGHDADSYLQHFGPRRRAGTASSRNVAIAERLDREGRLSPAGRAALGWPVGGGATSSGSRR